MQLNDLILNHKCVLETSMEFSNNENFTTAIKTEGDIFVEVKIESVDQECEVIHELHQDQCHVRVDEIEDIVNDPVACQQTLDKHGPDPAKCSSEVQENTDSKSGCNIYNVIKSQTYQRMCYLCSKEFDKETDYQKHMLHHSRDTKFLCSTCNNYYANKHELGIHLLKKHVTNMCCNICSTVFLRQTFLKTHMFTHSSEVFTCDLCKEIYVHKSMLTVHLRKHIGGIIHTCDVCSKEFESPNGLLYHKRIHTGFKPFLCNVCGVSFSKSGKLQRHERIHSCEKKKKCSFCEKTFVREIDLNRHIKNH